MAASKRSSSILAIALLTSSLSLGQCLFTDPPPPDPPGGGQQGGPLYESRNGWYLPTSGTLRILVVLLEVDHADPNNDPTGPNGSAEWPAHQLPIWANNPDPEINLFDAHVPTGAATGLVTRYFQQASSGQFTLLADYLLAPDNGGLFSTTVNSVGAAVAAVNAALGTSIVTSHGFSSISDFDMWTTNTTATGPGLPKITPSTESPARYDHVMFIWRNAGNSNHSGWVAPGSPGSLLGYAANTYSNFYVHNGPPSTSRATSSATCSMGATISIRAEEVGTAVANIS